MAGDNHSVRTSRHTVWPVRAWLALLASLDIVVFVLMSQTWSPWQRGLFDTEGVALLLLWGVSALLGAITAATGFAGTFRPVGGVKGTVLEVAWALAWLRCLALPITVPVVVASIGTGVMSDLGDGLVVVMMLIEAVACLFAIGAARRARR